MHRTVARIKIECLSDVGTKLVPSGQFKVLDITVEGTVEEAAAQIVEQGFVYDVQRDTAYPIHFLLSVEPA